MGLKLPHEVSSDGDMRKKAHYKCVENKLERATPEVCNILKVATPLRT